MRHDLRAVHHDLRPVPVGHRSHAVHIRNVSRHVGGRGHGDVVHVVLLEHPFKVIVIDPALFVHLGVDHPAALPPRQVVGVMLDPRGQDQIVLALDQRRSQLVQSVRRVVDIEAGIPLRIRSDKGQDLVPGFVVQIRGVVRFLGKPSSDGAVHGQLGIDLIHHRLKGRSGGRVVKIDQRFRAAVLQFDRFIDPDDIAADIVDGIRPPGRRSVRGIRPVLSAGGKAGRQRQRKADRQQQ